MTRTSNKALRAIAILLGSTRRRCTRSGRSASQRWLGFEAVRNLDGLPPEILMVPLSGHTAGHAGVAVQTSSGWLLHAGDAYLHHGQMDLARPHCPWGLAVYQGIMDTDRPARRSNQQRLRALKRDHSAEVSIFCSHDARELAALQGRALGTGSGSHHRCNEPQENR